MRASSTGSVVFAGRGNVHHFRWLQAGSSFAYRLAHLNVSRPIIVFAVALLFFVS